VAGLHFRFSELIRETTALKGIAKDFLDPTTTWVLEQLVSDMNSLSTAADDRTADLELKPLKTKCSVGNYERGTRSGAATIFAVVTGTWQVRPVGDNPKKSKAKQKRLLEFCGVASTKIELFDPAYPDRRIAMWRMELGAEDAPGCYFHVQVLGDGDEPRFPKTVPIPRFPSLFVTPMSVVEFVLGELFQDQWAKTAMGDSGDLPFWRELQRTRLKQLLTWHCKVIAEVTSSPWMTLKEAKPDERLFCNE
jgi:hypothetical protein